LIVGGSRIKFISYCAGVEHSPWAQTLFFSLIAPLTNLLQLIEATKRQITDLARLAKRLESTLL
jgi:hypothetical protein